MHLILPWAWLWLLPLGGAIIFLYLLKLRRKELRVSSVLLWRRATQDLQANAPFQRLKRNLLLFLQLAILILLLFALSRPFVRAARLAGQSIVVILDTSASMKATDVPGTRFGQAKRLALKIANDLGRGDEMTVIAASSRTRVLLPFSSDKRALSVAISRLEATDTRTELRDAVALALSLARQRKRTRVVVISDGAFAPLRDLDPGPAQVSFLRVGERGDNLAITALDARRSLSGRGDQVFVAMRSFSPRRRKAVIEILVEGRLLDAREVDIPAGQQKTEIFESVEESGLITARLGGKDDLAADDVAYAFLAPRRKPEVLLVTPGNVFLERALSVEGEVKAAKSAQPAPPGAGGDFDLVIYDRTLADDAAHNAIWIGAGGRGCPAQVEGEVQNPSVVDWQRNHPLNRFVDFSNLRIAKARKVKPRPWAQALVEAENTPLVVAGEQAGRRRIYVAWDLLESDFPLRVGFPIFLANCIEWATARGREEEDLQLRAGEVASLSLPSTLRELSLTAPGGRRAKLSVEGIPFLFDATDRVGLYRFQAKGVLRRLAVSLLSPAESDLEPRDQLQLGAARIASSRGGIRTNRELWPWFLLGALGLLCLEWYAFHRRI
jgi:hypothetical protein